MRQDDRGITLVEMIIAIAAAAIVIGMTTIFIQNALKSYGVAANTIDRQMDAQVLMEQIVTWVMEGNYVDSDTKVGDQDVFIIYNIPREPAATLSAGSNPDLMGTRWMRILWRNNDGELYMVYKDTDVQDPLDDSPTEGADLTSSDLDESKDNRLSDHVEEFTMIPDTVLPNKVEVTLTMKAGIQDYEFTNNIYMRNTLHSKTETDEP